MKLSSNTILPFSREMNRNKRGGPDLPVLSLARRRGSTRFRKLKMRRNLPHL
jgi:hypothetical protein